MHIARQRKPTIRIDMSPLIDCIFLLLIFFLLSSTFLTPKIQLELPKAASTVSTNETDVIVITVDAAGSAYLNSAAATWSELPGMVSSRIDRAKRKIVTLRCDENTAHKHFIRALEIAKSSGASHVNVAHQPPDS